MSMPDGRFATLLRRITDDGLPWDAVAADVLPIFERALPIDVPGDPPILISLPPGVTVGFGVDAGPAFIRISTRQFGTWPVDLMALASRALANLRRRVEAVDRDDIVTGWVDGTAVSALQSGDGWASTVVLLPEAIERLFGRQPAIFVAPSRDLLVRLPADAGLDLAADLAEAFERVDPNALRLEAFIWERGVVRCQGLPGSAATA